MFIRWGKITHLSFAHQKHSGNYIALRVNVVTFLHIYIELSSNSASVAGKKNVYQVHNSGNFLLPHETMEKLTVFACLEVR